MAGFASIDEVINAVSAQARGQRLFYQKTVPSTNVANVWHTLWKATGMPAAGGDPTKGTGGAVVVTKATTGAMPFTNASGGRTMHLLRSMTDFLSGAGTILICDRIAHSRFDRNQATASLSPVLDGTSRLATGEGGQLVMEVSTALGTGNTTRTFTYTDQDGNSSTTPNITDVASAVVGRSAVANALFLPLAAGDTGVRTVTDTTLGTTGTATGEYHLSIVRPLVWLFAPAAVVAVERDFVNELPLLPRIYDDSALVGYFISSTASATFTVMGEHGIAEN